MMTPIILKMMIIKKIITKMMFIDYHDDYHDNDDYYDQDDTSHSQEMNKGVNDFS